jgi:hypothetical protein
LTAALLATLAGLVLPALLLAGFVLPLLTGLILTLLRVALLLLVVALVVLVVCHWDVLRYWWVVLTG